MDWYLSIDFGTTSTAAAVCDERDVAPRLVRFGDGDRHPSAVWVGPDALVTGAEVLSMARLEPHRLLHRPKQALGDGAQRVGGRTVRDVALASAVLAIARDEATRLYDGRPPTATVLTHPARWSQARIDALTEAGRDAGLHNIQLVPEPVAAAHALLGRDDAVAEVPDGSTVALFDWGGGTLDITLLRRDGIAFAVMGRPGGDEHLGGEDLDEALLHFVIDQLEAPDRSIIDAGNEAHEAVAARAYHALKEETRRAKEHLSRHVTWQLALPSPPLTTDRMTLNAEDLVREGADHVNRAEGALRSVLTSNSLEPADLSGIFLAGGSCRWPVVARRLAPLVNGNVSTFGDPKALTALGALEWLARHDTVSVRATAMPEHEIGSSTLDREAAEERFAQLTKTDDSGTRTFGAPCAGVLEQWLVAAGDAIARQQPIATIAKQSRGKVTQVLVISPNRGQVGAIRVPAGTKIGTKRSICTVEPESYVPDMQAIVRACHLYRSPDSIRRMHPNPGLLGDLESTWPLSRSARSAARARIRAIMDAQPFSGVVLTDSTQLAQTDSECIAALLDLTYLTAKTFFRMPTLPKSYALLTSSGIRLVVDTKVADFWSWTDLSKPAGLYRINLGWSFHRFEPKIWWREEIRALAKDILF